ncbi:MAG TPA: YigZ family protein [Comamonas sp.]|uniref:IMPACT family protein n=1 Tax=Comamonas halotolerans TaxID=3041496 RepID=UPI0024E065BC|nr:YigZ family protein [Comamonas sp. NoAH]
MSQTIASPVHHELVIKKSRFLCCVQPMQDRASAQAVVDTLWQEHPGAAHVCWALLAGGQSAAVDDGEPSGTAGRPMLEVLRHQELEGVLATVVRYFGGVKLGAGGLVRAYTDCVAQALLKAEKITLQRMATLQCRLPYAMEGWLRRELELAGAALLQVQHQASVQMQWSISEAQSAPLVARINEGGQGRIDWLKFWSD